MNDFLICLVNTIRILMMIKADIDEDDKHFVQGKLENAHFVQGKLEDAHFVQGEYFVQGKLENAHFVQGE